MNFSRIFLPLMFLPMLLQAATNYTINLGTTENDGTGDKVRTAFGKVNTNISNILGTNTVMVIPSDGPNLSNSIAQAASGTTFKLVPGFFDVQSNHIRMPDGVNLVGDGIGVSILSGSGSLETNGCIVNPGSTSTVSRLSILCANRSTYYQAALGCAYYSGRPFTNATVRDVKLIGETDCWYVNTNAPCSLDAFNCIAESGWDAGTCQPASTAHHLRFFACSFKADMRGKTQPNAIAAGVANGWLSTGGRVEFHGCSLTGTNALAARAISVEHSTATVIVNGCQLESAGTNSAYKVSNTSAGNVQVSGIDARPLEISGTITWRSDNLVLTNVTFPANGLSFLDEEQLVAPIRITAFGGLVVGGTFETTNQDLAIGQVGSGIKIKEGANATMGTGKLTSGAATVSTTAVLTNSRIFAVSVCTANAAQGLSVSNIVSGTSFRVHSASGSDANRFDWWIINPAP